jgi:hypothetical protein
MSVMATKIRLIAAPVAAEGDALAERLALPCEYGVAI